MHNGPKVPDTSKKTLATFDGQVHFKKYCSFFCKIFKVCQVILGHYELNRVITEAGVDLIVLRRKEIIVRVSG